MADSSKLIEQKITFAFEKEMKKRFSASNIAAAAEAIGQEILLIALNNAVAGKTNDGKKLKVTSNKKYKGFKRRVIKNKLKIPKGERKWKKYKYKKWKTIRKLNKKWGKHPLTHATGVKSTTRLTGKLWDSLRFKVLRADLGGLFKNPKITISLSFKGNKQNLKAAGLVGRGYRIMNEFKFKSKQIKKIGRIVKKNIKA